MLILLIPIHHDPAVFHGDRGAAIRFALDLAQPGDIVLALGKGHEQSMCYGTVETPWSEHRALRDAIRKRLGREQMDSQTR